MERDTRPHGDFGRDIFDEGRLADFEPETLFFIIISIDSHQYIHSNMYFLYMPYMCHMLSVCLSVGPRAVHPHQSGTAASFVRTRRRRRRLRSIIVVQVSNISDLILSVCYIGVVALRIRIHPPFLYVFTH